MNDEELSSFCRLEFFKGTGNGGQKRNKTSSAVRVTLLGTDFTATDCSGRSQHSNRSEALRKLRLEIAYACRLPAPESLEFDCAIASDSYPIQLARLLDVLDSADYDHRAAAKAAGITPSALLTKMSRDSRLCMVVSGKRAALGLHSLHF